MESQLYILLDVLITTVLCAVIGFEREEKSKPAGLRTNMIVGGASCLIVSLIIPLIDFMQQNNISEVITTDPIRIIDAIVVGVSFIGAGTILKKGANKIEGLTTAATLLYSLGIGICIALKQYYIAVGITVLVVIINFIFSKIAATFSDKKND